MEKPNIEYINKLSRNDAVIQQKLVAILKTELPIEIKAYHSSLTLSHWPETMQRIHKLKNKIGILGLEQSYDIADAYEKSDLSSRKALQVAFEKTLIQMQQFVNCI